MKRYSFAVLLCLLIWTITTFADENFIDRPQVKAFIDMMVKKHHFKRNDLVAIFKEVKMRPQIMQQLNKPFEKQPWLTYQMLFVTQRRITNGVKFWEAHKKVLEKAEKIYGVPASIIVSTIGIESKYGERKGSFKVIESLTNIAFSDSPRAAFFKKELEQFLLLTREEKLNPSTILGSYAGAIGQPQFMPSSYRHYAINFSKSGKTDLMENDSDVIGSIANYYKKNGWTKDAPVAIRVFTLGDRYHYLKRNNKINSPLTLNDAYKLGLIFKNAKLDDNLTVKVIELQSNYYREYWLGFHNFDVIKRYNASDLYAMAVYELSEHIAVARKKELRE